jgi:predicted alpha/beta-hydrolase family hydrolase
MTDGSDGRVAVLAPGGNSDTDTPLLTFAARAARARGALIHPLDWGYGPEELLREFRPVPRGTVPRGVKATVVMRMESALDDLGRSRTGPVVVIGKSLGSAAASVVAGRGVPAVWFTPLLAEAEVAAALGRATAPCLLVGGTADSEWWDGDVARSITPHVTEIEGADHGLYLPGPLAASAAVLGEVATAVERFLDDVVWRS